MTNFTSSLSDAAALTRLGAAAERVRLTANLSQQDLAERAGVSKRTLERFEAGTSTTTVNLVRILRALGLLDHLDLIFPPQAPSPLEQLRAERRQRRRASPRGSARGAGVPRRRSGAAGAPPPPPSTTGDGDVPPFRWGDEAPPE